MHINLTKFKTIHDFNLPRFVAYLLLYKYLSENEILNEYYTFIQ